MPKGVYKRSEKEKERLKKQISDGQINNKERWKKRISETKKRKIKNGEITLYWKGRKATHTRLRNLINNPMKNPEIVKGVNTKERGINISKAKIGHKVDEKTREKLRNTSKGKHYNPTTEFKCGENNPNWRGGISKEPYSYDFHRISKLIRKRDNYICQECLKKITMKGFLCVHHIDYNKHNNAPTNLISLCRNCHSITQVNKEFWIKRFRLKMLGL